MQIIKKYSNRRLYDTVDSRYITLEDLADRIRAGADVMVQDAQDGSDITQVTLTQIILEARGGARLLPTPLLVQLIRLGDDALAEFFGRYVSWALSVYVQARQIMPPLGPIASAPFAATNAFARMVNPLWSAYGAPAAGPTPGLPAPAAPPPTPSAPHPPPEPREPGAERPPAGDPEIQALRRELDALKRLATAPRRRAPKKAARPKKKAAAKKK